MSAFSREYEYICPIKAFYVYDSQAFGKLTFISAQWCGDDEEKNTMILGKLKDYVQKFKGTHNFHNFTKKGNPKEKTNTRYIIDMGVERVPKEELEAILGKPATNQYVRFRLHGQSFIYHQIRKMIGSLVQMFQEDQDSSFIDNAFTYNKTPVWLAPSQGLLLDRVSYISHRFISLHTTIRPIRLNR